jgi:hypothetical protein
VRDPVTAIRDITLRRVKAFFTWLRNQRRGKDGRRVRGLGSEDSLGKYYKYFRLALREGDGWKDGQQQQRVRPHGALGKSLLLSPLMLCPGC